MQGIYKYPLLGAGLGILTKLGYFFFAAPNQTLDMWVRFAYLLFFLGSLMAGIMVWKQRLPQSGFTQDVKTGMKITSVFALIISSFTWIYYKWIETNYFQKRIQESIENVPQEQVEQSREFAEFIFDPFTHSTITLFGSMIIGFFYTLVIVLMLRWFTKQFN